MIIRQMKLSDIEQVYKIERETFSMPWSKKDFETAVKDENLNYFNIYLVAEEQEILGYCGLWGVAGEGQINNVAVKAECRNKNIGKAMLQKLMEIGKEKELDSFTLEVRVSNVSAIKLYHNLGFIDAGIRKGFYDSPKEDAIIMWLESIDLH